LLFFSAIHEFSNRYLLTSGFFKGDCLRYLRIGAKGNLQDAAVLAADILISPMPPEMAVNV
jgi:hypothetical protein